MTRSKFGKHLSRTFDTTHCRCDAAHVYGGCEDVYDNDLSQKEGLEPLTVQIEICQGTPCLNAQTNPKLTTSGCGLPRSACLMAIVLAGPADVDKGNMAMEYDLEIVATADEKISISQSNARNVGSVGDRFAEDGLIWPLSFLKESSRNRSTEASEERQLTRTRGSSLVGGDYARTGQMAGVRSRPDETATHSNPFSTLGIVYPPRSGHKVRLRRNRLVNVETVPDHLRAVTQRNERSSPFLRLPWDIKHTIYHLALGGRHIQINYQARARRWREYIGEQVEEHIPGGLYCTIPGESSRGRGTDPFEHRGAYPIARTCRQIYFDTALLYYSLNKFSFGNAWVMKRWMKSLRPVQKRAITRLVLPGGSDIVKYILKDLRGLKTIYLRWENFTFERRRKMAALWRARGVSVVFYMFDFARAEYTEVADKESPASDVQDIAS